MAARRGESNARRSAVAAVQTWAAQTAAALDDFARMQPEALEGGVAMLVQPNEPPAVRKQFAARLKAARSVEDLDAMITERKSQIGEAKLLRELMQMSRPQR